MHGCVEWGTATVAAAMGNLCAPAAEPPTPNPADDQNYSPPLGAPAKGNPIGENARHHPNVAGPHPSLDGLAAPRRSGRLPERYTPPRLRPRATRPPEAVRPAVPCPQTDCDPLPDPSLSPDACPPAYSLLRHQCRRGQHRHHRDGAEGRCDAAHVRELPPAVHRRVAGDSGGQLQGLPFP